MTTVKFVLATATCALSVVLTGIVIGCATQRLDPPSSLVSPYVEQRLWAVAPFANESGVSHVDPLRIADAFTYEIEQIAGVRSVPVNRVMAAMRALKLDAIRTRADAVALMRVLDVDGLVVGAVTAYDAYAPLKLGMAVELVSRDVIDARGEVDVQQLVRSARGEGAGIEGSIAAAQASGYFDASNHAVRQQLRDYARGRHTPESAWGERIYDVSIELYTRFVSHALLRDLLGSEGVRIAAAGPATGDETPPR